MSFVPSEEAVRRVMQEPEVTMELDDGVYVPFDSVVLEVELQKKRAELRFSYEGKMMLTTKVNLQGINTIDPASVLELDVRSPKSFVQVWEKS